MSCEGHYQLICGRGHYWELPEYEYSHDQDSRCLCDVCGEPEVWSNSVDDTNGEASGYVKVEDYLHRVGSTETTKREDGRFVTVTVHAVYDVPPLGVQKWYLASPNVWKPLP